MHVTHLTVEISPINVLWKLCSFLTVLTNPAGIPCIKLGFHALRFNRKQRAKGPFTSTIVEPRRPAIAIHFYWVNRNRNSKNGYRIHFWNIFNTKTNDLFWNECDLKCFILCVVVCITIYNMLKLMLTMTSTPTQALRMNGPSQDKDQWIWEQYTTLKFTSPSADAIESVYHSPPQKLALHQDKKHWIRVAQPSLKVCLTPRQKALN